MPAAAIAAPIVAAGAGFATAGVTAFTVAAGIGAVASTVGALTGVKELQYAGMGLTAVGSIGGMASAAGLFGEGATAAGGVAPLANTSVAPLAGAEPVTAPAQGAVGSTGSPGLGFMQPPTDTVAMVNGAGSSAPAALAVEPTPPPMPIIAQGDGTGGTLGTADNPAAPPRPGTSLMTTAPVTPAASSPATPALPPPAAQPASAAPAAPAAPGQGATPSADALIGAPNTGGISKADDSIWSKVATFAEKNPMLIYGALAAGGSFLSGATNPKMPAEVDALKARTALEDAQAEQVRLRTGFMQQGVPRASRRPRGILNQAVA